MTFADPLPSEPADASGFVLAKTRPCPGSRPGTPRALPGHYHQSRDPPAPWISRADHHPLRQILTLFFFLAHSLWRSLWPPAPPPDPANAIAIKLPEPDHSEWGLPLIEMRRPQITQR